MKIKIGSIVLAGGVCEDESPYDIKIINNRMVQTVNTIRGISSQSIDRGNQQTIFEFSVVRKHDSVEKAQSFILQHAAMLNDLADYLTIIEEPSGDMFFLTNAAISEVMSSALNNISTNKYKVVGGNFITNI